MKRQIALAALVAALASPLAAQTTMAPAGAPLTREGFRQMAMMADSFEIASSRLALERTRNPRVLAYARNMIQDHSMTSQALNGGRAVYGAGGELAGTATGALAGAGIGAVVGGPVGAAVGAGIGGAAAAAAETTGAAAAPIQVATPLDARKTAMLNELAAASGSRFDRLYGQAQRMAHQEALGLFTAYAQSGSDPQMVAFAQSVIPHLEQHLAAARRLPGGSR
jgi:predicted outer membrane protein